MSDEWWDLLDADGEPTDEKIQRGAAHWPTGRYHLVVAVCAINGDGRMLLTKRAAEKANPFEWEFPAGSVLSGETGRAAACRELWEETGLATSPDQLKYVVRLTETRSFLDVYLAGPLADMTLLLEPTEVSAGEWLAPEKVRKRFEAAGGFNPWRCRLDEYWDELLSHVSSALSR